MAYQGGKDRNGVSRTLKILISTCFKLAFCSLLLFSAVRYLALVSVWKIVTRLLTSGARKECGQSPDGDVAGGENLTIDTTMGREIYI